MNTHPRCFATATLCTKSGPAKHPFRGANRLFKWYTSNFFNRCIREAMWRTLSLQMCSYLGPRPVMNLGFFFVNRSRVQQTYQHYTKEGSAIVCLACTASNVEFLGNEMPKADLYTRVCKDLPLASQCLKSLLWMQCTPGTSSALPSLSRNVKSLHWIQRSRLTK